VPGLADEGEVMAFNQAKADAICQALTEGKSLRTAAKEQGISHSHFLDWVDERAELRDHYARARARGYALLAEEILEISDDSSGDVVKTESGPKMNAEFVARARLRVDSRKWMLSKMLPKVYGDKMAIGGADDLPPIKTEGTVTLSAEDAYKRMLGGG